MLPPSATHDLLAATLHSAAVAGWQRGIGIRPANYETEKHYTMWQEQVEAILDVFPSLVEPTQSIPTEPPEIIIVDEPADRYTHFQYAVITPDGCIDRNTIRPTEVAAWLSITENVKAEALSSRITKMAKVGFRLARVKISRVG